MLIPYKKQVILSPKINHNKSGNKDSDINININKSIDLNDLNINKKDVNYYDNKIIKSMNKSMNKKKDIENNLKKHDIQSKEKNNKLVNLVEENDKENNLNNKNKNVNILPHEQNMKYDNSLLNKNIKESKLIYPKDFSIISEKIENPKKKYLKAKISTKKMINEKEYKYENIIFDDNFNRKSKTITLKQDKFFNETNNILDFQDGEKDFFKSDSSNFINPLKYLKKSFQKKQEEKFEFDEDSFSNSFDFEEGNINDKYIKNKDKEKISDKKNNISNKIDCYEKEGETKENTESQKEGIKLGIRQKYKNLRAKK